VDLPALNATLNASSAVLLTAGWFCIKSRRIQAHRLCMISAFVTSALFLISYSGITCRPERRRSSSRDGVRVPVFLDSDPAHRAGRRRAAARDRHVSAAGCGETTPGTAGWRAGRCRSGFSCR
jgi:hypothetical protein